MKKTAFSSLRIRFEYKWSPFYDSLQLFFVLSPLIIQTACYSVQLNCYKCFEIEYDGYEHAVVYLVL